MTAAKTKTTATPRTTECPIERCDREIAEIHARPDVQAGCVPAWLVVLGCEDWEAERRLIEREEADVST